MRKAQTRWAGHVLRLSDSRIPKQLLYDELSQGRPEQMRGPSEQRFDDVIVFSQPCFFVNNEIYIVFLLNSQAQGVSGKNEQSTQRHGVGPNVTASG